MHPYSAGVAKGHSSFIRHFDWSQDSTVLQSNSGDFEMLFWEMPSGKQIKFPADTRNVDWNTWTCVAVRRCRLNNTSGLTLG